MGVNKGLVSEVLKTVQVHEVEDNIEDMRYAMGYDDAMFGRTSSYAAYASESYKMGFEDGLGDRENQ